MEKLKKVREVMKENGVDAYFITTSDYHQSEYIGEHFKVREFISGFDGSFGNLVITENGAALWTDGRYEVQIEEQLKMTEIEAFVVGKKNVPEIKEWIMKNISGEKVLGFDGKTVSAKMGEEFKTFFTPLGIKLKEDLDVVDKFWDGREKMLAEKAFFLEEKYAGKSFQDKLIEVKEFLKEKKCEKMILGTLDDIAWLFNIRGRDVKNTPVTLAYATVEKEKSTLYIVANKLSNSMKEILKNSGVEIKSYNAIYSDLKKDKKNTKFLINSNKLNFSLYNLIREKEILDIELPTTLFKSIKNSVEIENTKNAHIKDGVAVTKFIYWLKTSLEKGVKITELDATEKINSLRAEQENFIEPSFNTISAYMSNAAMPHYSATETSDTLIEEKGLYLVDSGGQYLDGTTDITRTIVVGDLDKKLKRDFTLVLKGMLALSMGKFIHGTTGTNLDILARAPLYNYGFNYNHGTGHGVGHVLGVHEGPQGIRMAYNSTILEPGMILSNEPAFYVKGSHGIRLENEILVTDYKETEFGKFYQFETLTFAPIDIDGIESELLNNEERKFLNQYHKDVFEKLNPFLNANEVEWLKKVTKKIKKIK
ncbi:MAG: aminopeptidase P family protein [Fusobacteriaceae bacterium]